MSSEEPQQAVEAMTEGALIAGRYRLVRQMAAGGMGTVWLARDDKLGRDVAVKIMAQALVSHSELLARFEREAKAVAQLRSTHVVEVYDYGFSEELPFMVMELLEGESLRTRLRRLGRMNLRDTAIIADQIAKGLKAAHTAGLVHRDLKPSNVFIATRDDVEIVKLLDFGVVKAVDQDGHSDMTTSGTLLGTPQYMSPEQVRARKAVDSRSDLWSLAVIVFRMLTGINPFRGESVGDAALRICSDELPRVGDYCDDLPSTLDRFFGRAFARDPDHRFQSADELSSNFRAVCAESLSGLAPAPTALAGAAVARGAAPPVFPPPQPLPPPLAPGQTRPVGPVASATPPPVVRRVGDPVVHEAPTPISISGFGSLSGPSAGIPPSVTPTPTPYSSPYGMPAHTPLPNIGPPDGAVAMAGPFAATGIDAPTTKIPAELRAQYLQSAAGGGLGGGGPATMTSIPGTNIPRPFVEPSMLIRPMSPGTQLLQSVRKLGAACRAAMQPLKQRLLHLRSPMPLVVATVVTLFVGALLAIVLLSPTDKTKRPAQAAQITSRFFNPAWTRVPNATPPDSATADTSSPETPTTAEPSATASAGPSMTPPEATGSDTAPDKHGKTGSGKTQKPRPKWF